MGCMDSKANSQLPLLTANLKSLYQYYLKIVLFVRNQKIFAAWTDELNKLIAEYLANPKSFDATDLRLCAVDSVHKLHPIDYGTSKVTHQWLLNACLRQHKFIQQFPIQALSFQQSRYHYDNFLRLCLRSRKTIVPNKLADFMWHSHMQDNMRYKIDTRKIFGNFLDHIDNFTEKEMKVHIKNTKLQQKKNLQKPDYCQSQPINNHYYAGSNQGYIPNSINQNSIYVIPSDFPQNQDICHNKQSQSNHSSHHHQTQNHHNSHHSIHSNHNNQSNHCNQEAHHSQCGASNGGASSCGGAASSCGGAASSCGGGASSCGEAVSSCGGAASSCGGGASSCGGAASSCGGAASSCGGGASSCGGAASSCGGYGSSCGSS